MDLYEIVRRRLKTVQTKEWNHPQVWLLHYIFLLTCAEKSKQSCCIMVGGVRPCHLKSCRCCSRQLRSHRRFDTYYTVGKIFSFVRLGLCLFSHNRQSSTGCRRKTVCSRCTDYESHREDTEPQKLLLSQRASELCHIANIRYRLKLRKRT